MFYKGNEPKYMTAGAAGADLICNETMTIGEKVALVPTGTYVEIPDGYFGCLLPRSSTCIKHGLVLANSMGVIDSDYRGEIKCAFKNLTDSPVTIQKGERIAQLIILKFERLQYVNGDLTETDRGEGGFGHTDTINK